MNPFTGFSMFAFVLGPLVISAFACTQRAADGSSQPEEAWPRHEQAHEGSIAFSATGGLAGDDPVWLEVEIFALNTGERDAGFTTTGCGRYLLVADAGGVVWDSRQLLGWDEERQMMVGCPPYEERVLLRPGESWTAEFSPRVDAILGDSLAPGLYSVTVGLTIDTTDVLTPVGRFRLIN
jgi:hypothetical protein